MTITDAFDGSFICGKYFRQGGKAFEGRRKKKKKNLEVLGKMLLFSIKQGGE